MNFPWAKAENVSTFTVIVALILSLLVFLREHLLVGTDQ